MNTQATTASAPLATHELDAAVRRGDHTTAEAIISTMESAAITGLAHEAMRARRWADAGWLFSRLTERDPSEEMKACLCRNLGSLEIFRPAIYQQVISQKSDTRYGIGPSASGRPTIVVVLADGKRVSLSPGNDPVAAAQGAMAQLKPTIDRGTPLGMCGLGDGYTVYLLARSAPKLFMDMEHPIMVLEPDVQILLHCLMIHDYSGAQGPIEQSRFQWFVGPDWMSDLRRAFDADLFLPCPEMTAATGLDAAKVAEGLRQITTELIRRDADAKRAVETYYAGIDPAERASLFGQRPSRKPRVLLVTTRFSTVLQHSTRDTAEAFRECGWDAKVEIEPSPAHRVLRSATRRLLAEFKPDLVFQIDHLRYEHGDLFPPELPFVCWIQDHMAQLRTEHAAKSITANDFVLTDAPGMYAASFGYPLSQCIPLTKLTRPVPAPAAPTMVSRRDDIAFVSNASHVPERIVSEQLAAFNGSAEGRALLERSADKLIATYAAGDAVPTYYDVLRLMRSVRQDLGILLTTTEFDAIAAWLAHPLNDALYRQQALRWAAQLAAEAGLSLSLYGTGWDKHPEFATYARGSIEYGPALAELTRSTRFNLQIVPYHCLHQRLLDGLAAGGFYLIRSHTADLDTQSLLDFLSVHAPAARRMEDARAAIPASRLSEFENLVERARPAIATSEQDDPVETVLQWADTGMLVPRGQVLPRFDLTSFSDASSLRAAITRFMADPKLRDEVRVAQRERIIEQFTYSAGVRRVVGGIGARLQQDVTAARPGNLLSRPGSVDWRRAI